MRYGTTVKADSYLQSHIDPELKRAMRVEVARRGMDGYNILLAEMWNCYVDAQNVKQEEPAADG